jgi:2'-5' RNA ligase
MGNTICPPLDKKLYSRLLEKCLQHLGVTVNYSTLGGGECGEAFLASGKIYKITTDRSEAIESNKLVGKKNKHLANVYQVKKIENPYTDQEVFLIVLEPLNTNRSAMFASLQDGMIEILESKTGEHFLDLLHYYRFEPNIYKQNFEEKINKALAPHQEVMFYYYSLLHICNELAANNIQSLDLQYRNLGMKPNGDIAFFDLGYGDNIGQVQSMKINESTIEEDIKDIDSILYNQNVDQLTFAKNVAYKLGYNSNVVLLGVGTQGFAADIGHNLVLKVTSDHSEAAEASRLLGRKNNYIGNFYKIYQISEPYTNMYAIIREKLEVNAEKVRTILIATRDFVKRLGVKTPTNFAYFLRDLVVDKDSESLSTLIEAANNIQDQVEKKNVMNILYMIDEMISRDMLTGDFISTNLGFKANGVLAYYDVGLSDRSATGGFPTLTLEDITERELKYMKNASAVSVDKKCAINGNGDGTSTACNQGEIKNIKLSKLDEGQKTKIEYGAVMLMFDINKWDEITDIIEKDDVYDQPTFGIEKEPHVTILYGLHKEVTVDQVKEKLNSVSKKLDEEIKVELIGISHFETPAYDVVKFDAKTDDLTKMNKVLKELPFTSNFPDYHPHMSISYVKKGTGSKYNVKFDDPIKISSNKIVYSLVKGTKFNLNEHTSRWNKRLELKKTRKETKIEVPMILYTKEELSNNIRNMIENMIL